MKSKTFNRTLSKCALTILAALTFVGCSDYDNGFTDKDIAFQQSFREKFGDIDPNHTWSTVTRSTLTVGVDMPGFDDPYIVRVYTANPRGKVSNCYLLGQWTADNPSPHDYVFDMPAGLKTVWVAVTKQNGGRYVQQARIVDHKCTANFTLSSAAYGNTRAVLEPENEWEYFPYSKYYNDKYNPETSPIEDAGFIQIYPEDDVNYESGICTDFEIVATGEKITLTHFYSNTRNQNDNIKYFIYNPEETTVQQANENKENHILICSNAGDHVEHYSGTWIPNRSVDGGHIDTKILSKDIYDNADGYAMRGKKVTIDGLTPGDHIVFYLDEDYKSASTRAILNETWTPKGSGTTYATLAGVLNYGHRTYIGFEDALELSDGETKPNEFYDLNDVVYILEGDFTIEDHEDELPRDMSYIIAYEDLGISDDFDFNDLVVRVTRVSGTPAVTFTVLAAGGTLPVSMYHTRDGAKKVLFEDIHKLFGQDTKTVINAYDGAHSEYTPIRKTIELPSEETELNFKYVSIEVTQSDGKTNTIYAPQYYDLPSNHEEDTFVGEEEFRNPSNAPYAILIADPTWDWPNEGVSIAARYSEFIDWVKDANHTTWYGSIWKEKEGGSTGGIEPPTGELEVNRPYPLPFQRTEDKTGYNASCFVVDLGNATLPEDFNGYIELTVMTSGTNATINIISIEYMDSSVTNAWSVLYKGYYATNSTIQIKENDMLSEMFNGGGFVIVIYDESISSITMTLREN